MVQEYFDAADKISQLADEYDDCDEISKTLKAGSAAIIKMAAFKGGLIKTASSNGAAKDPDDVLLVDPDDLLG
jgi:hypothetical protein